MSLWKIAWRSIQQRSLASLLTTISMALGVALVATVLVIHAVVDQSFSRSAQGFDIVVGAKGSPLELVLNTVYHYGQPPENIPYTYYREFAPGGKFYPEVDAAVPICKGDNFQGDPVIGTVPERFTKLKYRDGLSYQFVPGGHNFESDHYFEAVVGSQTALKNGITVGQEVRPSHGTAAKTPGEPGHQHEPFKVVGILAPTGTPADSALYVNMEGFFRLEGHIRHEEHEAAAKGAAAADHDHDHDADHPLADEDKRVTAVLVSVKEPALVRMLARQVNEEPVAQAAFPAEEIDRVRKLVGDLQTLLLFLAVLIVVVAGIGILVSIYNSMHDRRRDIAIMRALGARRQTVMVIILLESVLLALGGGALGVLLAHSLIVVLGPVIRESTQVVVRPWDFQWVELVLIPGLIALAAAVGYLPAVVAYRTDVARSLTATG